jgi:uncharacterized protein
LRIPYYETSLKKKIKADRQDRRERIERDLLKYGGEILESAEMKDSFGQTHHLWSTVGEHTVRVTVTSVLICYALRKLNIPTNIPAVVVGSLCHDLGIMGRDEKFSNKKEMSREHPRESVNVARTLVPELSDTSEEIIERHMWPAGGSKAPGSKESLIVSVADKYTAVKDIFKGSDVKGTGVRNTAQRQREFVGNRVQEQIEKASEFINEITE